MKPMSDGLYLSGDQLKEVLRKNKEIAMLLNPESRLWYPKFLTFIPPLPQEIKPSAEDIEAMNARLRYEVDMASAAMHQIASDQMPVYETDQAYIPQQHHGYEEYHVVQEWPDYDHANALPQDHYDPYYHQNAHNPDANVPDMQEIQPVVTEPVTKPSAADQLRQLLLKRKKKD